MNCLTWNLEWASSSSPRADAIRACIGRAAPDVACYTELDPRLLHGGYLIEAGTDYGCRHTGNRRKVVLWSTTPWSDSETCGDPCMPPGRFAAGITRGIRFVGVCIPWKNAHVRTGRKDQQPWQEHIAFCQGLERILQRYAGLAEPVCVMGDFNQTMPSSTQPLRVAHALARAIPHGFTLITAGTHDANGKLLIDHIAVSSPLRASITQLLPRHSHDGLRLSDHTGVVARLRLPVRLRQIENVIPHPPQCPPPIRK